MGDVLVWVLIVAVVALAAGAMWALTSTLWSLRARITEGKTGNEQ